MNQQRQSEAARVEVLITAALTMIGAQAAVSAFAAWMEMAVLQPAQAAAVAGRYITEAMRRIRVRRRAAREVMVAGYRLVMALRTGTTVSVAGMHQPGPTTLQRLRAEFHETLLEHAPASLERDAEPPTLPEVGGEAPSAPDGDTELLEGTPEGDDLDNDDTVLWEEPELPEKWQPGEDTYDAEVQAELERLALEDAEAEAEYERGIAEEMRRIAAEEYAERLSAEAEKAREAQEDQDQPREEQRRNTGARLAGVEQKAVRNGDRLAQEQLSSVNKKRIGTARYSPGGCCAFCGVLILNGPYMAPAKPPKLRVHNNCDCEYVDLYGASDYDTDPRFKWNRYLARVYPNLDRTSGRKNGNEGLNALRRHIYQLRKQAPGVPAPK